MSFSSREAWTAIHGMVFGFGYLLFFTGAIALLITLRDDTLTPKGQKLNVLLLKISAVAQGVLVWFAVVVGTWVIYPWYRAASPEGATDLAAYPKMRLLASPTQSGWHEFGMEWKEHLAWLAPILATAAVFIVLRYAGRLASDRKTKWAAALLMTGGFVVAGVVGVLGALITKAAPVQ